MLERVQNAAEQARLILRSYLCARQHRGQLQHVAEEIQNCDQCNLTAETPSICDDHNDTVSDIVTDLYRGDVPQEYARVVQQEVDGVTLEKHSRHAPSRSPWPTRRSHPRSHNEVLAATPTSEGRCNACGAPNSWKTAIT